MAILNIQPISIGQAGQTPAFVFINTNSTVDEVTVDGFLNKSVSDGIILSESQLAIVTTKTSPNARSTQTNTFGIIFKGGNWSLTSSQVSILPVTIDSAGNMGGINNILIAGDAQIDGALTNLMVPYYVNTQSYIGGSASFDLPISGMVNGDVVYVMPQNTLTAGAYLERASAQTDMVTIVMNVDPDISNYSIIAFHLV